MKAVDSCALLIAGILLGIGVDQLHENHIQSHPAPVTQPAKPAKMDWQCDVIKSTNPVRFSCYLPEGSLIEVSTDNGQHWQKVEYLRVNQQTLSPRFPVDPSGEVKR